MVPYSLHDYLSDLPSRCVLQRMCSFQQGRPQRSCPPLVWSLVRAEGPSSPRQHGDHSYIRTVQRSPPVADRSGLLHGTMFYTTDSVTQCTLEDILCTYI